MSPWTRAFWGAFIGAAITLCIHPASRPFVLGAFFRNSAAAVAQSAGLINPVPPSPSNLEAVGVWMILAADKLQHGDRLSKGELHTLSSLAVEAENVQPDNAYWKQMHAVFLSLAGDAAVARSEWTKAGNCQSWNDFQTEHLLTVHKRLTETSPWNQAWTYGFLFFARSDSAAAEIQRYAGEIVRHTVVETDAGLAIRYSSIRNGFLLREFSRSIKVGSHGAEMVELATYPPSLSGAHNPRRIWIAQTTLSARLRQLGLNDEAVRADDAFERNEAWRALTERRNPEETMRNLCLTAVVQAAFPGAMAAAALVGFGLLAAGRAAKPRVIALKRFHPAVVVVVGLWAAAFVMATTRSWAPSIAVGACVWFLAASPSVSRSKEAGDLGPLFGFLVGCDVIFAIAAFSAWLVCTSTGARALLPYLGPTGDYLLDSNIFLSVGDIAVSLLCLIAPSIAIAQRFPTPKVFFTAVRRFGALASVLGLALCIVTTPIAIASDHDCGRELSQLLQNEPLYYFLKHS